MKLILAAFLVLAAPNIGEAQQDEYVIVRTADLRMLVLEYERLRLIAATMGCI